MQCPMDDVLENVENRGIHQTMSSLALLTVQVSIRTTIEVSVHEYASIISDLISNAGIAGSES